MVKIFKVNNKKFIIFNIKKKKLIKKIFHKDNLKNLKNEITGYKKFKKLYYFKIPKFYSSCLTEKDKNIIIEYIYGTKPSIFDLNRIYNRKKIILKNTLIKKYLNDFKKKYKNYYYFKSLYKDLKFFKTSNKKILTTFTHGDFANYNCLKSKNFFYVFDFEKFGERIILYDFLNWFIHPLSSKYAKLASLFNLKINNKYFINMTTIFSNILIWNIIYKIRWFKSKIDKKNFELYVLLYLFEKIIVINNDLKFVKNKKNKELAMSIILILRIVYKNFLKNIKYKITISL